MHFWIQQLTGISGLQFHRGHMLKSLLLLLLGFTKKSVSFKGQFKRNQLSDFWRFLFSCTALLSRTWVAWSVLCFQFPKIGLKAISFHYFAAFSSHNSELCVQNVMMSAKNCWLELQKCSHRRSKALVV